MRMHVAKYPKEPCGSSCEEYPDGTGCQEMYCDYTHQLKLTPSAVGFLDATIIPECLQGWDVQLKGAGFDRHACFVFEGHNKHAMLLVLRVLPGNAKFVSGIHQYPHPL